MDKNRNELDVTHYIAGGFAAVACLIALVRFNNGAARNEILFVLVPSVLIFFALLFYKKVSASFLSGLITGFIAVFLLVILFFVEWTIHPPDEE